MVTCSKWAVERLRKFLQSSARKFIIETAALPWSVTLHSGFPTGTKVWLHQPEELSTPLDICKFSSFNFCSRKRQNVVARISQTFLNLTLFTVTGSESRCVTMKTSKQSLVLTPSMSWEGLWPRHRTFGDGRTPSPPLSPSRSMPTLRPSEENLLPETTCK